MSVSSAVDNFSSLSKNGVYHLLKFSTFFTMKAFNRKRNLALSSSFSCLYSFFTNWKIWTIPSLKCNLIVAVSTNNNHSLSQIFWRRGILVNPEVFRHLVYQHHTFSLNSYLSLNNFPRWHSQPTLKWDFDRIGQRRLTK